MPSPLPDHVLTSSPIFSSGDLSCPTNPTFSLSSLAPLSRPAPFSSDSLPSIPFRRRCSIVELSPARSRPWASPRAGGGGGGGGAGGEAGVAGAEGETPAVEIARRTGAFMRRLQQSTDPTSFQIFTKAHIEFCTGNLSAADFVDSCISNLGASASAKMWPELVQLFADDDRKLRLRDASRVALGIDWAAAAPLDTAASSASTTSAGPSNSSSDFPSLGPASSNHASSSAHTAIYSTSVAPRHAQRRPPPQSNADSAFPALPAAAAPAPSNPHWTARQTRGPRGTLPAASSSARNISTG
eukprot:CAMPEP_0174887506 /NCGR_PEP_ID=MMETSP0167-20121228/2738_1 /TAXON_ID=38298 /ORGANISM="Rhodella maculata, Strain CCMP736" /LENGTH=298 /DNA_ID=CAMNT_0016123997 /DNA_START=1 /DNA_END=894 /DNA_ORIENTATION=+